MTYRSPVYTWMGIAIGLGAVVLVLGGIGQWIGWW